MQWVSFKLLGLGCYRMEIGLSLDPAMYVSYWSMVVMLNWRSYSTKHGQHCCNTAATRRNGIKRVQKNFVYRMPYSLSRDPYGITPRRNSRMLFRITTCESIVAG